MARDGENPQHIVDASVDVLAVRLRTRWLGGFEILRATHFGADDSRIRF